MKAYIPVEKHRYFSHTQKAIINRVRPFKFLWILLFILSSQILFSQETLKVYLSGEGSDRTVDWQFFCTEGRQSGEWGSIPVPSNWEQFGYGNYNYGYDKDSARGKEKGLYKHKFFVPEAWESMQVDLVFEGSMTDTEVLINGKSAGDIHQGSFYRFTYDISKLLKFGQKNLLEVTVSKHSENESVNGAERRADFWIFGGIFRPVYLEVKPTQHIDYVCVDAGADGSFLAEVYIKIDKKADQITARILDSNGCGVGDIMNIKIDKHSSRLRLNTKVNDPDLWSSEFPNLYSLEISLMRKGKEIHSLKETFGFRTVELRERDGIYLNGQKIKFRGVNRHSFRPETGRALSRQECIDDVVLIKSMNMNAVRNSHYPADEYFFDACDSLGLLVMDELAGWHDAYDTEVGSKLVKEMFRSNHNHPSIVIWANGNEGGHNNNLVPLYDNLDLQNRPIIHPWKIFRGTNTQHYRDFDYGTSTFFHGHDVVFPTEFLHGLYDGGHGAGLKDFWEYMWDLPLSAGGFLWVFADEGVMRTDREWAIDTDGNHGADGILGPHHEKEGSYYTIKEVWSPVHFEQREITPAFDGSFTIENRFSFTNISQCLFKYSFADYEGTANISPAREVHGNLEAPDIVPGSKGVLKLDLPDGWNDYDVLYITAKDQHGKDIFTWSWPVHRPEELAEDIIDTEGVTARIVKSGSSTIEIEANGISFSFNKESGLLTEVRNEMGVIPFNQGPVLCDGFAGFRGMKVEEKNGSVNLSSAYSDTSNFSELTWMLHPSGLLQLDVRYRPSAYFFDMFGISFSYPEELVEGVRWMGDGPYRVWKNRMEGTSLGVYEKEYNNTITGSRGFIYPEFKGYHSNLYWARILSKEQDFEIVTTTEDLFLRLFTPEFPNNSYNTAPVFPTGEISFMHGIPPIGTKSLKAEQTGPSGRQNIYFDYWPWENRARKIRLYFNFGVKKE